MLVDLETSKFRNIYIIEDRACWTSCPVELDKNQDLVLTYDFGLCNEIKEQGGDALFLDHIVEQEIMQKNNFIINDFLGQWYLDNEGKDLFIFQGVPFGASFKLDIWNDFTFQLRLRICLEHMTQQLDFNEIYLLEREPIIKAVLQMLGVSYQDIECPSHRDEGYYFPIFRYMHENTRSFSLRSKVKDIFMLFQGSILPKLDGLLVWKKRKPKIFIQEYHPTRKILQILRDSGEVQVVVERISATSGYSKYYKEWAIPMRGRAKDFEAKAHDMLLGYQGSRSKRLVLDNGSDVSEWIYNIIDQKIKAELPNQLRLLHSIIQYTKSVHIDLQVLIANIGRVPSLLDAVLKKQGVPSYLIINGLLGPEYSDESKYATMINGYSTSIQTHYFKGQKNVVCLGDPRMDEYVPLQLKQTDSIEVPTITIGASGFNPVDLNSYVAVEFDFLHDVLKVLQQLITKGYQAKIIIKVRPNGYQEQYERFVQEYYPTLVERIVSTTPMKEVLEQTDFYISIYSQTLFEASCLGVPVVYYKKDNEVMDTPFDEKSELITANNKDALMTTIVRFYNAHELFQNFLEKTVMEKYIGPLDGRNTERNIAQIYKMLNDFKKGG